MIIQKYLEMFLGWRSMELSDEDELDKFDKSFHKLIEESSSQIDPSKSARMRREGLGKIIDVGILLRIGLQQTYQYMIVFTGFLLLMSISGDVAGAFHQIFGVELSGFQIGLIAVGVLGLIWLAGILMFLRGGSQRSRFEIQQKVNPAQRLDLEFKRAVSHSLKRMEKRDERIEKRLDRLEEKVGE